MTAPATKLPPYKDVYNKIREAGLSAALIKKALLPSWWDKEAEKTPAACQEAYLEIASKLGVPYQCLIDVQTPLNLTGKSLNAAFKTGRKDKKEQQLLPSAYIGIRLAQIIAKAYQEDEGYIPFTPKTAEESRENILTGASWVSFCSLLDFCWRRGVPVIHWQGEKGKAFDGMATITNGIPIIILGSGKNTAWTTFHLAHELGHIMLGHLQDQEMTLDNLLNEENKETGSKETEANDFAKTLLYGSEPPPKADLNIQSKDLRQIAIRSRISPASILQNSCWLSGQKSNYQILNARLKNMKSVYNTREKTNDLLRTKIGHDFETSLMDWQQEFLETLLA